MSRRPAIITQADVARVLRAVMATGYDGVPEIRPDGSIRVLPRDVAGIAGKTQKEGVDDDAPIPL